MRLILLSVLCASTVFCASRDRLSVLKNDIERIIHRADPTANVGIDVVNVATGERLYSKNRHQRFIPASSLKLLTMAAAYEILGVDYVFATKIYTDGKVDQGVVYGNLYLKGSGDPTLNEKDLEALAHQLRVMGIHEVKGNLVVDASAFDTLAMGPGWMWEDISWHERLVSWNAPSSGLSVNQSCLDLWIRPATSASAPAHVICEHPISDLPFAIDNQTLTFAKDHKPHLELTAEKKDKSAVIHIFGQLAMQSPAKRQQVPVQNPPHWAGVLFKKHLEAKQIALRGNLEEGITPPNGLYLGEHTSDSLFSICQQMCKSSNNFMAHCIFKSMGSQILGSPGSWQSGSKALQKFLGSVVKMNPEDLVFLDGSGLSRFNLISPMQMTSFLTWAHEQPMSRYEFMASLPIGGIDGTLKNRFTDCKGRIRAKTGTMTGISSLSGYCFAEGGDLLAFTIIVNGSVKPGDEIRSSLIDPIARSLVHFSK